MGTVARTIGIEALAWRIVNAVILFVLGFLFAKGKAVTDNHQLRIESLEKDRQRIEVLENDVGCLRDQYEWVRGLTPWEMNR